MDLNNDNNDQDDSRSPVKPVALLVALLLFIGLLIYSTQNKKEGTGGGDSGKGTGTGSGQGGGSGKGNSDDGADKGGNSSEGNKNIPGKKGDDAPSESNTKTDAASGKNSNGNAGGGNTPNGGSENPPDKSPSKSNSSDSTVVPAGNFTVDDKIVWEKATEFIRRRTVFYEKVKMPALGVKGTNIKKASDSSYVVNGYFDAPNIKGETKRSTFKCIVFLSQYGFDVDPNQYTID